MDGQNRMRDQPSAASCRLNDENSRGKVQNVRVDSSAAGYPAAFRRLRRYAENGREIVWTSQVASTGGAAAGFCYNGLIVLALHLLNATDIEQVAYDFQVGADSSTIVSLGFIAMRNCRTLFGRTILHPRSGLLSSRLCQPGAIRAQFADPCSLAAYTVFVATVL
jgi:hypothetical protein